jgi:hypothetical protein
MSMFFTVETVITWPKAFLRGWRKHSTRLANSILG